MGRFVVIALAFVFSFAGTSAHAATLHDGETVKMRGVLRLIPGGRQHYVALLTMQAYSSGLKGDAGKPQHAIGLAGYNDYKTLYTHRGGVVTVLGKVAINDASPYYRNGMVINVTSIRTVGGEELIGTPAAPASVPGSVTLYHEKVTLPLDAAAPWQYIIDGKPDTHHMLSCRTNGAGDVVNCDCAPGFHPTGAVEVEKGRTFRGDIVDTKYAQFPIDDDRGNEHLPVTLNVTCSR